MADWKVDLAAFSETSHTWRAVQSLRREFKSIGHRLAFGRPVDDKFPVRSSAGSFRGKFSGVVVSSVLPVYSFEDERVSACIWASSRLLHSVVQCGHLPVHVLVAYLHPCAYVGSEKHEINARILAAAASILEGLHGPALLVGDWNSPADSFEPIRMLHDHYGYQDVALLCAERAGCSPEPTCKGATRHSFIFASPDAVRFVKSSYVGAHFDLDAHAVLFAEFNFPMGNPVVLKWVAPASLDQVDIDLEASNAAAYQGAEILFEKVADQLEGDNLDQAIAVWSDHVESHLLEHGSPSLPSKRYRGRCQKVEPRPIRLAPARLKGARPGDFSPAVYVASVQVRQLTKQVRRLKCYSRAIVAIREGRGRSGLLGDQVKLWNACLSATGFQGGFIRWLRQNGFVDPGCMPDLSWCQGVLEFLETHTQALARSTAQAKSQHFVNVVEDSWTTGGSLPFRLMRDPQPPEVLELALKVSVQLAPQRWLPFGKAWLKLRNAGDFQPGDVLEGDAKVRVVEVQVPYVSLSAAVSRKTAASLYKTWVEGDPAVWAPHFLRQWEVYWQRDEDLTLPPGAQEYLDIVQQVQPAPTLPLDYDLWTKVLKGSKASSMRGVDGWSFSELKLVPRAFVEVLLHLFSWFEQIKEWPRVFNIWLVVLLRKVATGILPWSSVRPISVAATLYRTWAKMRTQQLLVHARSLATATVQPCLSTRSIWGIQVELTAEFLAQERFPCGVVLDLIKAFNVVCRPFLEALMIRLGFPVIVVQAWFASMKGLTRQPLVAGSVFGSSSSTTGIPEGDPISILGMFSLCCLFREVVRTQEPLAVPFSYADNWEVVAGDVQALIGILEALDRMTTVCLLPVAPSKCWTWAFAKTDRKVLGSCSLAGQRVPVRKTGCCLGADMAYSYQLAAATRNGRVSSGHKRLLRLRGLPTSRFRKCRLILGGVYPHALHACEASWLPPSVLNRLRSKAVQALKLDGSGVNPFLACNVAAPKVVDPEVVALFSRLRLFRLLWKDFPEYRDLLLARLSSAGHRFKTPTDHLVRALADLGWNYEGDLCFSDSNRRKFSLVLSSLCHIRSLLMWQWGRKVAQAICHRKGLEGITDVDLEFSRPSKSLLPSERGLLCQLVSGRHFTRDARSKFAGSNCNEMCPHCESVADSRAHRVFDCQAFGPLRRHFRTIFEGVPRSALLFGLWPFPEGLVQWQASLDSLPMPVPVRKVSSRKQCFFTDGSCLFPAVPDIRIAAAAVVTPGDDGNFSEVWSGLLPSAHQTIQRAEVLAGAMATGSASHPVVVSDSLYFVRIARRLLQRFQNGIDLDLLPSENSDVWEFFWKCLQGCKSAEFVWVKAHQDFSGLSGAELVLAQGNDAADMVAKRVVLQYQRTSLLYRSVVRSKLRYVKLRTLVDSFHLYLAKAAVSQTEEVFQAPVDPSPLVPVGDPWIAGHVAAPPSGFHEGFVRQVFNWFATLKWYQGCSPGPVSDISWVELFMFWVVNCGCVPPFRVDGRWVRVGEDEDAICCVPSAYTLFRTWRRAVSHVLRCCNLVPGCAVTVSVSAKCLGARMPLAGLSWRPSVPLAVRRDLAFQFASLSTLASLRLPPLW